MTLLIYYLWFSNSFTYYALSLNSNDLAGGDHPLLNFFLMGLVEAPSYLVAIYLVRLFGSRRVLLASTLAAGLFCWATPLATAYHPNLGVAAALVGKFAVTASYSLVYVYTTEVFPTVVRTIALGSGGVVARFGSMSAPYLGALTAATSYGFSMAVVGAISILAAVAIFPLEELSGTDMPDRPEDIERAKSGNENMVSMTPNTEDDD